MLDHEMKPGDVRSFKKGEGSAVVLAIGIWDVIMPPGMQTKH